MTTFLVTGGAGFIGSHLCEALRARGEAVRVLDDLSTGKRENLAADVELIEGDVADTATVQRAVEGVAGCFHLAAIASVERGVNDWLGTHRANLTGAITLFDAIRRLQPGPSGLCVLGRGVWRRRDRADRRDNAVPPALRLWCRQVRLRVACARGEPRARHPHRRAALLQCLWRRGRIRGRPIPASSRSSANAFARGAPIDIFGDGGQTRDFVLSPMSSTALLAAMRLRPVDAPVFNVCTGIATSVLDLARTIAELAGTRPMHIIKTAARRRDPPFHRLADTVASALSLPEPIRVARGTCNVLDWLGGAS